MSESESFHEDLKEKNDRKPFRPAARLVSPPVASSSSCFLFLFVCENESLATRMLILLWILMDEDKQEVEK